MRILINFIHSLFSLIHLSYSLDRSYCKCKINLFSFWSTISLPSQFLLLSFFQLSILLWIFGCVKENLNSPKTFIKKILKLFNKNKGHYHLFKVFLICFEVNEMSVLWGHRSRTKGLYAKNWCISRVDKTKIFNSAATSFPPEEMCLC